MTLPLQTTFHVVFEKCLAYGIEVQARTEDEAIALAEGVYARDGEHALDLVHIDRGPFSAYPLRWLPRGRNEARFEEVLP
jgi:hypothetical protein